MCCNITKRALQYLQQTLSPGLERGGSLKMMGTGPKRKAQRLAAVALCQLNVMVRAPLYEDYAVHLALIAHVTVIRIRKICLVRVGYWTASPPVAARALRGTWLTSQLSQ